MGTFLFIVCVIIVGAILYNRRQTKNEQEKQTNEQSQELNELIEQLDYEVKSNNTEVNIWKNFHEHNLDLGEPAICFNGHAASSVTCAPWDCSVIGYDKNVIMSAPTHEERIKNAISLLANLETHRVHDITNSAIFYEEARVVVINMICYNPKDIVSVRSKVNREDDTVTFTITLNNLLDPTTQITLPRSKEDDFKAAMTVFRKMK